MWLYSHNNTVLVEYDSINGECRKIGILSELNGCENHCFDGDYIWLVPKDHKELLRWDYRTGAAMRYSHFPEGLNADIENVFFSYIVDLGKSLLLIPKYGNMIIDFDKETNSMTESNIFDIPSDSRGEIYKFDNICRLGDKIFVFSRWNNAVYVLDCVSMTVKMRRYITSEEDYYKYIQGIYKQRSLLDKNPLIWESWFSGGSLESYFNYLQCFNNELTERNGFTVAGDSGVKIYEHVKSSTFN
jgi:hypothetical protein